MFKDQIKKDINSFININEFGEQVNINGVQVNVVEDSDKLQYRIKKDYDGLIIGNVLFYIEESELNKIPRISLIPNASIRYKNQLATVTEIFNNSGVYEVIIQYAN